MRRMSTDRGRAAARAARGRASRAAASAGRPRGGRRPGPGPGWSAARGRARRAGGRAAASRCARSAPARARGAGGARTAWICSRSSARLVASGPRGRRACRPSVRRIRCTSTPITPERSPWRPNAAIASRARSRISPSLPSAIACADRLAQLVEVDPLAAVVAARPRRSRARAPRPRRRGRSSGRRAARRPAGPPATWRSSRRAPRGSPPVGPGHLAERRERVEDLGGADGDALGAQLLAEADEPRREARRR